MSSLDSPDFEDLEPEGDNLIPSDSQEPFDSFEDDAMDEYLDQPMANAPFSEQEEPTFETLISFEEKPKPRKRQNTVAMLAARVALKWGSRATRLASIHADDMMYRRSRPTYDAEDWFESIDDLYQESDDLYEDEMFEKPAPASRKNVETIVARLAKTAVSTNQRAEAERLMAAIVPLVVQKAAHHTQTIWSVVPVLVQGVSGITRLLHSRPDTRRLLIHIPTLLNRTVAQLVRHIQNGSHLSHRQVAQMLAKQTAVTLQQFRDQQSPRRQTHKWRSEQRNGHKEWWNNGNHA